MDNASLVRIQSRFLILGGIVLFTNVFLTLFLCARRVQIKRDLTIDHERFYTAVQLGTSNYLHSIVSKTEEESQTFRTIDTNVKVHYVSSLSTWFSPRSGYACQIDDCVFRVGDYCDLGVVVSIADGRVYVDDGEHVVIVRRRTSATSADAPTEEGRRAVALEGGEH